MFKYIKKSFFPLVLVSSLVLFGGCGSGSSGSNTVGNNFVSAEVIDDIDASVMLSVVKSAIDPTATNAFGYKAVKINYNTQNQAGDAVEASGLLVIPTATAEYQAYLASIGKSFSVSMLCDNHGTIFTDAEAPSNVEVKNGLPDYQLAVMMTGLAGFAAVLPDYLGYGTSNAQNHPYMLKKVSARVSLDMIRASVRYMTDTNVVFNSQLYISGYSQGGYTAMALAEEIETNHNNEFTLMGVAPMAGPYLLKEFTDLIIKSDGIMSVPAFMAFTAKSYSDSYDDLTLGEMILDEKEAAFDGLFNGTNSLLDIQTALALPLGAPTASLYEASFISEYESSPTHKLKTHLLDNTVGSWGSKYKMNLIHCSNDDVIPVAMTYGVENVLNGYGATSVSTTIIDSVTADYSKGESVHSNCGVPAYTQAIGWFNAIRNGDI